MTNELSTGFVAICQYCGRASVVNNGCNCIKSKEVSKKVFLDSQGILYYKKELDMERKRITVTISNAEYGKLLVEKGRQTISDFGRKAIQAYMYGVEPAKVTTEELAKELAKESKKSPFVFVVILLASYGLGVAISQIIGLFL